MSTTTSRFRFAPGRAPAVAANAMIATSQLSASLAGQEILRLGGNAVDAAIAAAAVLCVSEPMSTSLGGDAFAIVADGTGVHGMDAGGPAPLAAEPQPVPTVGPASSVVPGAVSGWDLLSSRFGRLGLDRVLSPAIDLARGGVAAGFHVAREWQFAQRAPAAFGPAPALGTPFRLPDLARTLELIAEHGPDGFYRGEVARAITDATWLAPDDLEAYGGARWVTPLSVRYRDVEVLEMPPPTQGVAALEGLALLSRLEPTLANQVRVVALALEDAFRHVADGADVTHLLSEPHLSSRLADRPVLAAEPPGGTVYLCCVDDAGMAVSFIQSIFDSFGSGVVPRGTGFAMNNRAACFATAGAVVPGRRPYHTIIPGMLCRGDSVLGPFGCMGGYIQAQAHVQLISALVDRHLDPQAALDLPRFRLDRDAVHLEEGLWDRAAELSRAGFRPLDDDDRSVFGGGQIILIGDDHLVGGSDPRKDGVALGF